MSLVHYKEKVKSPIVTDSIESCIFLKIDSESASSGPPIGPILGQYGIPAAQFCTDFNERSEIFNSDIELRVTIYLYKSGIYTFEIDLPTTSFFFKTVLESTLFPRYPGRVPSRKKISFLEDHLRLHRRRKWSRSRHRVITSFLIFEVMRYRSKFELLKLNDYSNFKCGLGIIKSMGIHIIN